ncbi:MAG TPA: hypothetical protein ENF63_00090 [Candidatus Bathyarchaeota archaeon]|nr:hypothetical protein [Candidatus Bathyarchaeota archaeon]
MRYALRALKWATIILWLFLFSLVVTLVYSVLNIRIEVGDPQLIMENERIVWAMPAVIDNAGFYGIYNLNITTLVADIDGGVLLKNSTLVPLVQKGELCPLWHNVSLNLREIPDYQVYLLHDTNFTVKYSVSLNFARIIPCTLSLSSTMPWGAPLYNLSISDPTFQSINATHCMMFLNVSFENHSPYIDLNGTLNIEVLNENGEIIGIGEEIINVPSYQIYDETLNILVDTSKATYSGTIKLTFETSMFSYETEVPYELG